MKAVWISGSDRGIYEEDYCLGFKAMQYSRSPSNSLQNISELLLTIWHHIPEVVWKWYYIKTYIIINTKPVGVSNRDFFRSTCPQ
jgi:hypothetical protein